jgi:hypothetical protein
MARPIPDDQLDEERRKMMAHQDEESGKWYSPVPPLTLSGYKSRLLIDIRIWLVIIVFAVVFLAVWIVREKIFGR